MKTIVIKESYIREQGWPESLKGALRLVRKETDSEYRISQQGERALRRIPKDQVSEVSYGQVAEEVILPTNISGLLDAASRLYGSEFFKPFFLPNKQFVVVDTSNRTMRDGDVDVIHQFYEIEHKGSTYVLPVWCCIPIPPQPMGEQDVDKFVRKFGLEKFQEVMGNLSQIVKVKPNGVFVTRESFNGEQRFTVRKKVARSAQIQLVSKFGEHMEAPQL